MMQTAFAALAGIAMVSAGVVSDCPLDAAIATTGPVCNSTGGSVSDCSASTTCTVDCVGNRACPTPIVGFTEAHCHGIYGCEGGLTCREGEDCSLLCDGESTACRNLEFNCPGGDAKCDIDCQLGCYDTTFTCASFPCYVNITCSSEFANCFSNGSPNAVTADAGCDAGMMLCGDYTTCVTAGSECPKACEEGQQGHAACAVASGNTCTDGATSSDFTCTCTGKYEANDSDTACAIPPAPVPTSFEGTLGSTLTFDTYSDPECKTKVNSVAVETGCALPEGSYGSVVYSRCSADAWTVCGTVMGTCGGFSFDCSTPQGNNGICEPRRSGSLGSGAYVMTKCTGNGLSPASSVVASMAVVVAAIFAAAF